MSWIVGIDEAGYGPNLGPFVMTAVACRIPEPLLGADLWQVLHQIVRRERLPDDGRLFVNDSKAVYSTLRGMGDLETSVWAALAPWRKGEAICLAEYVDHLCPEAQAELRAQPWYAGSRSLPVQAEPGVLPELAERFALHSEEQGLSWGAVRSVVVCPARFNELLAQSGSKGSILALGLTELLRAAPIGPGDSEPVFYFIDKHGGRNHYAAVLQEALPEGFVWAQEEGSERSTYTILGLPRAVRLTIEPRADQQHFCVALASMVSKYLRELLMLDFNDFWQQHVPGLKPTAGYPGDAARFFAAIRPVLEQLQIAESTVWRRK